MTGAGRRAALAVAAAVAASGCAEERPPLADCGGDLRGVWRDDAGRRWHAIAGRAGWELYPMFDDTAVEPPAPAGVVVAPAAIDLPRAPGPTADLRGTVSRRFEGDGAICWARTAARLHACRGDRARLDVQPPRPPLDLATCAPAPPAPVETWHLARE